MTSTLDPTGAVAVSTPKRFARTAPLASLRITQPDSTPSEMVPVSSVAVEDEPAPDEPAPDEPAPDEPAADEPADAVKPEVPDEPEGAALAEPVAVPVDGEADAVWLADPEGGVAGAEEPHAATPQAISGKQTITMVRLTVRWVKLVESRFLTRRRLDDLRFPCDGSAGSPSGAARSSGSKPHRVLGGR